MIHIIKNNSCWRALVLSLTCAGMLSACGSDSDNEVIKSVSQEQKVAITGTVVKGTLASAIVQLFKASDLATPIATTSTGTNGEYELTYTVMKGENFGTLIVKVSVDDDTTMVCDADECDGVANGSTLVATELGVLELSTHLAIDANQNDQVNVNDVPINTLTTVATSIILAETSDSDLSAMTLSSLSSLQKEVTLVVMSALGVSTDVGTNLFDINLPDASDIPNGLSSLNTESSQQGLVTQLSMLNASFAANADIDAAIKTFSQHISSSINSAEFSADLTTFLAGLQTQYNDLFSLLTSLDGGLPTDLTIPGFDPVPFPHNISFVDGGIVIDPSTPTDDGDIVIDPGTPTDDGDIVIDPGTTTGDWTLTIMGTVTVTSPITITTDIPTVTVNDVPAPASDSTSEIENIFSNQIGSTPGVTVSNLSFRMTENTANRVVVEYSATISVEAGGITSTQTQNLVYTWTK